MAMIPWGAGGSASDAVNGLSQVHEAQKAAAEGPKLCVECKHYRQPALYAPKCALTIDLVTGAPGHYCEAARREGSRCGPAGVRWEGLPEALHDELVPSLLSRLKRWISL